MKTCFSFILVFAFLSFQAQETDFCIEFLEKEKVDFQKFRENEIKNQEKYTYLREKIFTDLKNNKEITTDNITLCIVSDTFVNDYIPAGHEKDCRYKSTLYYDQRAFTDSIFWNKDTFLYVINKFHKNIFPAIKYGKGIYLTEKNYSEFFSKGEYSFITDSQKVYFPEYKDEIYYFPENSKHKSEPVKGGFTNIHVVFTEYENVSNVVLEVRNPAKAVPIRKTYQYIDNQWKLIEPKNEY